MTPAGALTSPARQGARAARAALQGQLPARYGEFDAGWRRAFKELAAPGLRARGKVLDAGGGRRPMFAPHERREGSTYVGLDILRSELEAAPAGSYDEMIAADATQRLARLENEFDLIVSWQVFEHLRSVPDALENFYAYLKPGGYAIIAMSGRYSAFGILNMLLPQRLGVPLVARVMRRDPATVFPAYYDKCYRSALQGLVTQWSSSRIISAWAGARYFGMAKPLQAAYILYEEWAAVSGRENLATHYFMQLRK